MKKWKGSMKMNADTFYGICTINYPPPGVGNAAFTAWVMVLVAQDKEAAQ